MFAHTPYLVLSYDVNRAGISLPNAINATGMFYTTGTKSLLTNYWYSGLINLYMPNVRNIDYMFSHCPNLQIINLNLCNLGGASETISAAHMFNSCPDLTTISGLKLNKLVNTAGMFSNCSKLYGISGQINMSTVTNAYSMFSEAFALVNINCLSGNFSNITFAGQMFNGCRNLTNIAVTKANMFMPNVTSTWRMFFYCNNLKTVNINWDMPNLVNTAEMFWNSGVNTYSMQNANLPNLKNIYNMFSPNWTTINLSNARLNSITDFSLRQYSGPVSTTLNLVNAYMPNCNRFGITSAGLTSLNVNGITTGKISPGGLLSFCTNLAGVVDLRDMTFAENVTGLQNMFAGCGKITSILLNPNQLVLNASDVTISNVFNNCRSLTQLPNIDLVNIGLADTTYAFSNCRVLDNITVNMSNTRSSQCMFENCHSLRNITITQAPNLTQTGMMFSYCYNLTDVPANLVTNNVAYMYLMFGSCSNLTNIAPQFNTMSATNMAWMFTNCYNLVEVNLDTFNIPKAQTIAGMFYRCNNLSNASIQNIINMCLTGVNIAVKNLSVSNESSPLRDTPFTNAYYQDRLQELTEAGWSY